MSALDYILAARVPDTVPEQSRGLWTIERWDYSSDEMMVAAIGFRTQTRLRRLTMASLHQEPGEVVMEDGLKELSRHLPIWLAAKGRVLVTGLGLGCVVRGLLAKPAVEHITVVERDRHVISMVWSEFADDPRCELIEGDALAVEWPEGTNWDFAWHDIWSDSDKDEPHLQNLHAKLLVRYQRMCPAQGAWQFPRWMKRWARERLPRFLG